jgi:protoporphyrinogen oxidase
MSPLRVAVLGGGVAGIVGAHALAGNGHDVTLFEERSTLGGLHESVDVEDLSFDIGTFTFNAEHEYFRRFPGLEDRFVEVAHTNLSLTPSGSIGAYPLSPRAYLRDHGLRRTVADLAALLLAKARRSRRDSLIAYLEYYLGPGVYRRSGLRHYIERLYGLPDSDIDLEFARRRLSVVEEQCSLRRNAMRLLIRTIRDTRHFPWRCRVRPAEGFGSVYAEIGIRLQAAGVRVITGARPHRLRREDGAFHLELESGVETFQRVVSTIPMETAAALLGVELPFIPEYRDLVSLFYVCEGEPGFDSHCLYNFSLQGTWKRLTLFSRYHGPSRGRHYFTVECTVMSEGPATVSELAADFESHAVRHGAFRPGLRLVGHRRVPRAYPLYRNGATTRLHASRLLLEANGLTLAGRQGRFDYASSFDVARRSAELGR